VTPDEAIDAAVLEFVLCPEDRSLRDKIAAAVASYVQGLR